MTVTRRPELLDVLAVLASPGDPEIRTGDVGTLRPEHVLALNRGRTRVS